MAISVLVAVADAGAGLVPRIEERMRAIRVGGGVKPDSDKGPLVTAQHLDRVTRYLKEGVSAGAELVVDGRDVEVGGGSGYFLGPCLFDRVRPEMSIYRDEIFGPVLSIMRVESYDDARALVDANPYANGVPIFTNDGGIARQFQSEIQVGMVGINVPIPVPMAITPSGAGRARCSGTLTSTEWKGYASTRAGKWSPRVGPHPSSAARTWAFRSLANAAAKGAQPTREAIHHVVPPASRTPPRLSSSPFCTGSCTDTAPASSARL